LVRTRDAVMLRDIRGRAERLDQNREVDMAANRHPYPERRELAHRVGSGLVVTLWWDEESTDVAVSVADRYLGAFQLVVDGHQALHAFYHPFAVAAACGRTTRDEAA
jgi:hypothetical protein